MSKTYVPLDQIRSNPHQSRLDIGDVERLAESILEHGLRQLPEGRLLVDGEQPSYSEYTEAHDGEWYLEEDQLAIVELASGHRRIEAVRHLNMDDTVTDADLEAAGLVPGYVPVDLQRIDGTEMLDLVTIENVQREELSPIEEARLIKEHAEAGRHNPEIGEAFGGKSPSWVSNRRRLLHLPRYVQEHVHEGDLSVRQGLALATAFAVEDEHGDLVEQVNVDLKPGTMVQQAVRGGLTSDGIRDRTRELTDFVERVEAELDSDPSEDEESASEAKPDDPTDLPCAFCGVEEGQPCTTRDGEETDVHRVREKALAAQKAGVLDYERVSAVYLRSLIEPPSTKVDYSSGIFALGDLVAAHQILRGYQSPTARNGHKARARKIRVEITDRVEVDGEVSLDAEEVIKSAPKWLRDRLENVRTMDLDQAIKKAAGIKPNPSTQTDQTDADETTDEEDAPADGGAYAGARADGRAPDESGVQEGQPKEPRAVDGSGNDAVDDAAADDEAERTSDERHVASSSGDGTPADHPAHLPMLIDAVEGDSLGWQVGVGERGYYARLHDGDETYEVTGAATPADALQEARSRALAKSSPVGHVHPGQVDALVHCDDPESMWDQEAAEEASIASLYVAYRIADVRQERWRREEIAKEMRRRSKRVTKEDFPETVWQAAQKEIERRLEPQAA